MNYSARILLVEDDEDMRDTCMQILEDAGYTVTAAHSPKEAEPLLLHELFDIVITDLKMPHGGGKEVLRMTKSILSGLPVILITAFPSVNSAVDLFKGGVVDYLIKPFTTDQLINAVIAALNTRMAKDNAELMISIKPVDPHIPEILGNSAAIARLLADIRRIATMDAHVLVSGETGTGKELVCKAIHRYSRRAHRPLVTINCASLPDTLIESEIFGHEKGAFTDARDAKPGMLEVAHGSTLFLDEIGDVSLLAQAKLLRAIEEKQARRVGGIRSYDADVRVVAATNKNLKEEIRMKRFREDLYYRISSLEIDVPPLRSRGGDISLLAVTFLNRLMNSTNSKNIAGFSDEALGMLSHHSWPGNIREVQNVVQKVFAYTQGPVITQDDLIQSRALDILPSCYSSSGTAIGTAVSKFEKEFIEDALHQNQGNISKTAITLGIHRTTLQRLIRKLKIDSH